MNDHASELKYSGARFYKCALQVNPYSYGEKYRNGLENNSEEEYNKNILSQCKENNISVIGLADHGSVKSSESLRELLQQEGIVVFPGFEISSSEKIHMVCLYPEDAEIDVLTHYLSQLMGDNYCHLSEKPTHPSSRSCEEIAGAVINKQKGFWYAAHMTGSSGLLKRSNAGSGHAHLWKREEIVIAGQIPSTLDDLQQDDSALTNYHDIINNTGPEEYRRKKPIVIINAKDVARPQDLKYPSTSCLIKMTQPGFSAFKMAFKDPRSRIQLNHDKRETVYYSKIEFIRWEGASFFRTAGLSLSENLNSIIGGRGTGKSTLIESIRHVLELDYWDNTDNDNLRKIAEHNLRDAKVTIGVKSKAQNGKKIYY